MSLYGYQETPRGKKTHGINVTTCTNTHIPTHIHLHTNVHIHTPIHTHTPTHSQGRKSRAWKWSLTIEPQPFACDYNESPSDFVVLSPQWCSITVTDGTLLVGLTLHWLLITQTHTYCTFYNLIYIYWSTLYIITSRQVKHCTVCIIYGGAGGPVRVHLLC